MSDYCDMTRIFLVWVWTHEAIEIMDDYPVKANVLGHLDEGHNNDDIHFGTSQQNHREEAIATHINLLEFASLDARPVLHDHHSCFVD